MNLNQHIWKRQYNARLRKQGVILFTITIYRLISNITTMIDTWEMVKTCAIKSKYEFYFCSTRWHYLYLSMKGIYFLISHISEVKFIIC